MKSNMNTMSTLCNICTDINGLVKEHLKLVLENIALTYNLNEQELKDKYIGGDHGGNTGNTVDSVQEKKKRGRKKKQKDEFIEAEEYEYEGQKYLVDGSNNVYTYNIEEPTLIGERLVDGTVKLFT